MCQSPRFELTQDTCLVDGDLEVLDDDEEDPRVGAQGDHPAVDRVVLVGPGRDPAVEASWGDLRPSVGRADAPSVGALKAEGKGPLCTSCSKKINKAIFSLQFQIKGTQLVQSHQFAMTGNKPSPESNCALCSMSFIDEIDPSL